MGIVEDMAKLATYWARLPLQYQADRDGSDARCKPFRDF